MSYQDLYSLSINIYFNDNLTSEQLRNELKKRECYRRTHFSNKEELVKNIEEAIKEINLRTFQRKNMKEEIEYLNHILLNIDNIVKLEKELVFVIERKNELLRNKNVDFTHYVSKERELKRSLKYIL